MGLAGLTQINIELTSRCDKACSFCGHQDPEVNKRLEFGDMDFELLCNIENELDSSIIVQFHRDGESLLYPRLGDALRMFHDNITSIVTNGKKLVEKGREIIDNCTAVTVSAFHGDPDGPEQLEILKEFLQIKGDRKPRVLVKWVGDKFDEEYSRLGVPIIRRQLHDPDNNFHYSHSDPPVPEHGICLDFLNHPSIDWQGIVYVCNRLDLTGGGAIGRLDYKHRDGKTLEDIWESQLRLEWLEAHKRGRRDQASPLCHNCKFYGIPTGG